MTWKCASRHNGVHFFMSHLASWLRTRRFSEPTFRPSGATNHWKNTVNRDFPIFSRIYLFFLLIFSLLTLFTSAFQLSILSEVSLLNFLRKWVIFRVELFIYQRVKVTKDEIITRAPAPPPRSTRSTRLSLRRFWDVDLLPKGCNVVGGAPVSSIAKLVYFYFLGNIYIYIWDIYGIYIAITITTSFFWGGISGDKCICGIYIYIYIYISRINWG